MKFSTKEAPTNLHLRLGRAAMIHDCTTSTKTACAVQGMDITSEPVSPFASYADLESRGRIRTAAVVPGGSVGPSGPTAPTPIPQTTNHSAGKPPRGASRMANGIQGDRSSLDAIEPLTTSVSGDTPTSGVCRCVSAAWGRGRAHCEGCCKLVGVVTPFCDWVM